MEAAAAIRHAEGRLKLLRSQMEFTGQIAAYKELARLKVGQGMYSEAAEDLLKAAKIAEYLDRPNEVEALHHALIALYEQAGNPDGVIETYGLLHIYFDLMDDRERAVQYNQVRLDLVAKQIGKSDPPFEERFNYEFQQSARSLNRQRERFTRLLNGVEEPTIPDEHAEACNFLVTDCLSRNEIDEALHHVTVCERAMQSHGPWVTGDGIEHVRQLRDMVDQRRRSKNR